MSYWLFSDSLFAYLLATHYLPQIWYPVKIRIAQAQPQLMLLWNFPFLLSTKIFNGSQKMTMGICAHWHCVYVYGWPELPLTFEQGKLYSYVFNKVINLNDGKYMEK